MKHVPCLFARALSLAPVALLSLLWGCSTPQPMASPRRAREKAPEIETDWTMAERSLRRSDWAAARKPLARLAQRDIGNGHLQFLYALSEESLSQDRDLAKLSLAEVGYTASARLNPGHYWSLLRLGFVYLQEQNWTAAQARFSEAIQDQPKRWEAYYGLGVASYFLEDYAMLVLASEKGLSLAPGQPETLRLAAFARAIDGSPAALDLYCRSQGGEMDSASARIGQNRLQEFLDQSQEYRPNALALPASTVPELRAERAGVPSERGDVYDRTAAVDSGSVNQVVIEVTILLSSVLQNENRGVNLLDGLRVLYGYENTFSRLVDSGGSQNTRAIVSRISSPELNYSLNLFNDSGQYYNVVARPSITAYLGRESSFFSGRVINVELSSVNVSSLEPVEVGVGLTVTPETIDTDKVTVNLTADRSYLSREEAGSFDKSLSTFRQSVSATAEVRFGQTLVLSALSEQVNDRSFSQVPFVGQLPVLKAFSSQKVDTRRQEALLILLTPSLPTEFDNGSYQARRSAAAERLRLIWTERLEPGSDLAALLDRVEGIPWLRKPERGDLALRLSTEVALKREAIDESLLIARR